VPDFSSTGKLVWAYITYIGVGMTYTATGIAYTTLLARMTDDSMERTQLNMYRLVMGVLPIMMISAATIPLVNFLGKGDMEKGFQYTVVFFSIFILAAYWTAFTRKEQAATAIGVKNSLSLGQALSSLKDNRPWLIIAISTLLAMTLAGIMSGITMYYLTYYIKRPDLIPVLLPLSVCTLYLVIPLIPWLVRKFGKRDASIGGLILFLVALVVRFVTKDEILWVYMVTTVIGGLGLGVKSVLIVPLLADTIEYGEWKTDIRTEALIFSANSFGYKLGMGIGSAVLGVALSYSGYLPGVAEQPESVLDMLFFLAVTVSIMLCAFQIGVLSFYKLDKDYPMIVAELRQRKEKIF